MKSSSQQMESMDEMVKKVEKLSNRRKNISKQTAADKKQTSDSKVWPVSLLGPVHDEDSEHVAPQVWNEMFEDKPFDQIAITIAKLLDNKQLLRILWITFS